MAPLAAAEAAATNLNTGAPDMILGVGSDSSL